MEKFARHDLSQWALAGGFAVEIHCKRAGREPAIRPLNDLDFIAPSFDCAPATLARENFLFRHVHPADPPGKTMLQFFDTQNAVRIDLFRTVFAVMSRTQRAGRLLLISPEDMTARSARLLMDLAADLPCAAKYARDYLRISGFAPISDVETAWIDHREPSHPATFREADSLIRRALETRADLLITPQYSKNTAEICPRCASGTPFALAEPAAVLALAGYC